MKYADDIVEMKDLRAGDLIFMNIGGAAGLVVKLGQLLLNERVRIGPRSVDHVLIVTGMDGFGPCAVQAMPHGAEEIALEERKHFGSGVVIVRMREDYPGQGEDAAVIARAMAGTPYSFGSYLLLAAWRFGLKAGWLERKINARRSPMGIVLSESVPAEVSLPKEAICSVLADQAWSLVGKRVCEGVAQQAVTPGKLLMSAMRRGAVWYPGRG